MNDLRDSNDIPKSVKIVMDEAISGVENVKTRVSYCSSDNALYLIQIQFLPNNFKRWFFIGCYTCMGIFLLYISTFTIFQPRDSPTNEFFD